MKKNLTICLLILLSGIINSQNIKLYYENIENGFILKADNEEYCPVSVKINFKLKNLKSSKENNTVFVIPPKVKNFQITELKTIKKGKKYNVSSQNTSNYGNHNKVTYDKNYVYELPFEKGKEYRIMQGYNGTFSHFGENTNALDFDMPIGTNITAVRSGVVIKVVDKNRKGCPNEKCKAYNNTILIYHNDGTFAEYAHIKYKGSKVKVGNKIESGQIIAESGNVGWSSAPHLHLAIFKQKIDKRDNIKAKFKVDNSSIYLKEKELYKKL